MVNKNRKIILIIAAAILVIGIAAGTTIVLISLKKPQESSASISPEEKADTTKDQAIEALKNGDTTQAKTLFTEANQEYTELGDTDNIVDTEAQLYLIEHSSTQSTTISEDPTAASN